MFGASLCILLPLGIDNITAIPTKTIDTKYYTFYRYILKLNFLK